MIKKLLRRKAKINPNHFRVAIYGSARLKKNDKRYKLVYNLAKRLAKDNIDVITGGGPGLMAAANEGHHKGQKEAKNGTHSIGLTIKLPREQRDAYHLDIKKQFQRFSNRLDSFIELSDVVVVAPGGIGTLLEFMYTWQLVQVKQICETPIILLGGHWQGLLDWVKKEMANKKLMNQEDFNHIFVAKTNKHVMEIINQFRLDQKRSGHVCKNFTKYKKEIKN